MTIKYFLYEDRSSLLRCINYIGFNVGSCDETNESTTENLETTEHSSSLPVWAIVAITLSIVLLAFAAAAAVVIIAMKNRCDT